MRIVAGGNAAMWAAGSGTEGAAAGTEAASDTEAASGTEAAVEARASEGRLARLMTRPRLVHGGPRPTPGHEGPRGHGEAAGRIPRAERHLAAPADLVFVDRQGNEVSTPSGREPRADGYYPYVRDGHFQLTREAAAAFRALRQEGLEHGYNLRLNDGFRPDAEQARRHLNATVAGVTDTSARVALAGTSEHRTGRAFDIGTDARMPDGSPARTSLGWAIENAELFGINHYDGPPGERMHFSYHVR